MTNGYNAYLGCGGRLYPTNAQDVVRTTTLSYSNSWLGNYYQPTNSPLINKGSITADQAGLHHFTTQTNQVKETNTTVKGSVRQSTIWWLRTGCRRGRELWHFFAKRLNWPQKIAKRAKNTGFMENG